MSGHMHLNTHCTQFSRNLFIALMNWRIIELDVRCVRVFPPLAHLIKERHGRIPACIVLLQSSPLNLKMLFISTLLGGKKRCLDYCNLLVDTSMKASYYTCLHFRHGRPCISLESSQGFIFSHGLPLETCPKVFPCQHLSSWCQDYTAFKYTSGWLTILFLWQFSYLWFSQLLPGKDNVFPFFCQGDHLPWPMLGKLIS